MEKIRIGRIVNAAGLRGEVKVRDYSGQKKRYGGLDRVIIDGGTYGIEKVRYRGEIAILKLKGVDDRNAAEAMKTKDVFITEDDLEELPEGTYYIKDLIGTDVIDLENGEKIGRIRDVIQNGAQDIYRVELFSGKECLIPAVSEFVKEVNLNERYVKVKLIEGMKDL